MQDGAIVERAVGANFSAAVTVLLRRWLAHRQA